MIAPISRSEQPALSVAMRHARRLVACTLLSEPSRPPEDAPPVAAWRAWVFAAWVALVTAVYAASMAGLW